MRIGDGLDEGRGGKERIWKGEKYIYTYEDSIMKPTKHCLERGKVGERE
jgi:hypothetical protein